MPLDILDAIQLLQQPFAPFLIEVEVTLTCQCGCGKVTKEKFGPDFGQVGGVSCWTDEMFEVAVALPFGLYQTGKLLEVIKEYHNAQQEND